MSGPAVRTAGIGGLAALIACLTAAFPARPAGAQPAVPVVHAVLFHSPMCSFCEEIIEHQLPPLVGKYGSQLDILQVNIESPAGLALYQAALETYGVSGGIPVLFLDGVVLKGEAIPEQLPDLVDARLLAGGADWPPIPGLDEYRRSLLSSPTPSPAAPTPGSTPTFAVPPGSGPEGGSGTVVRAVLFFSETCSHCLRVRDEVLPPLQERFGPGLEILPVDTRTERGNALYESAFEYLHLRRPGIPFLVIGLQYLIGDVDISQGLPALVEQAWSAGGVDWPDVPGLPDFLEEQAPDSTGPEDEILERIGANLALDPLGSAASIAVLAGMLVCAAAAVLRFRRTPAESPSRLPAWTVPALCLAGLGVAVYMAYVEIGRVEAVCGPVGDCNTVQQSTYARLFGVLPVGVLGVIGYLLILQAWLLGRAPSGRWQIPSDLAVFGLSAAGFLFSLYLTLLEPFVIGASCSWCLLSAAVMTALFWASLRPARAALFPPPSRPG